MLGEEKLVIVALWSFKKILSAICHNKSIMEYQCSEAVYQSMFLFISLSESLKSTFEYLVTFYTAFWENFILFS